MNRNVRFAKVVDGLVDAVKELNVRGVGRAEDAADSADAAAAAHASAEHVAVSSWKSAIEKEPYERVMAELRAKEVMSGLGKGLSDLHHVEAPKDDPSFGIKLAEERRYLGYSANPRE